METVERKKPKGFKRFISIAGRVAFIVAILFLISYLVTVLTESTDFFRDASGRTALVQFEDKINEANDLADEHYENLYAVAERVEDKTTKEEVVEVFKEYIGSETFGDLRFYVGGEAYDPLGKLITEESYGNEEISALVASNRQGCSAIYRDGQGFDCMAFFTPVRGAYVNGVLSILKVRVGQDSNSEINIPLVDAKKVLSEDILAAIVIDENGMVYSSAAASSWTQPIGIDLRKFIGNLSTDASDEVEMQTAVQSGKKSVCHVAGVDGDYIFTVAPIESLNGNLFLVTMTERGGLIAPEMQYVRYVVNLTIVCIVSLTIGMIYAFFYYRNSKTALEEASNLDPVVGCANAEYFRVLTDKAIANKEKQFAVVLFEIRQFGYLQETLSKEELAETLKFISKVMDTFCTPREKYGYFGAGKFALLLVYTNEKSIRERTRLIETVLNKNVALGGKTKRIFYIGVGLALEDKRYSAQELINHASTAVESAKNNVHLPFVLYNEEVNVQRENNVRIELEMESALANNEFRLFLQPKYNVAEDKIDSAEALVRWFDPKKGEYRFPGEFISLFESNGFIVKLDHFMYVEVLKYMQAAAERGEKQVPISVNVSLVTASESNFLSYYIENKKKYGVPDGFITIEFTESFLMEDHQKLREMVERLHRNGIRCSLDDFGTGYASFSLLKDVSFDELKIDRTLLGTNFDKKEDAMVVETIVQLGKSLGMRIVQEGVETKAVFDKLVESGVEIIQGYYYAKAIPLEEYKLFLGSNTSIKYKSLVK